MNRSGVFLRLLANASSLGCTCCVTGWFSRMALGVFAVVSCSRVGAVDRFALTNLYGWGLLLHWSVVSSGRLLSVAYGIIAK